MSSQGTSSEVAVVRHHGMRTVTQEEVTTTLASEGASSLFLIDREINTAQFAMDGGGVSWDQAHGHVWAQAQEIRELLSGKLAARATYFGGFPEVPLVVALGAYVGEEWTLEPFDRHRDGNWRWPAEQQTLELDVVGAPSTTVRTAGPVVIRVEISASVDDHLVHEFIAETEEIGHIRIRPRNVDPKIAERVQSPADVREVRRIIREVLASVVERLPNTTAIHLFVSAPPSACLVVGQELRLRNMPAVETYRYRRDHDGVGTLRPAIRLCAAGPSPADIPLTDEERGRAASLRESLWRASLRDVEIYAANKRRDRPSSGERWYDRLAPREELMRAHPFPSLPPVYEVIPPKSTVVDISMESEFYGYERESARWRVNDRFLLRLENAFQANQDELRSLVRLFMFHESLHVAHGISKAKVEEVGKFANGLEHVDYTADLYAILHELDRSLAEDPRPLEEFDVLRQKIVDLIDVVIRSFWAFEPPPPLQRMEIRRIRRYMNWYWQQARVAQSKTRLQLAAVLARKPIIEIAGLDPSVESRRYYGALRRFDRNVGLELGIVLDDEELKRVFSSVTVPLAELMAAFSGQDHSSIRQGFRKIFEEVGEENALPRESDIS